MVTSRVHAYVHAAETPKHRYLLLKYQSCPLECGSHMTSQLVRGQQHAIIGVLVIYPSGTATAYLN